MDASARDFGHQVTSYVRRILDAEEFHLSLGVGTELIRHVQAWARDRDIDRIELQVAEFNTAAIAWYETLGISTQYRRMAWSAGTAQDSGTPGQRHD